MKRSATLPDGWEQRLIPMRNAATRGATGWCLEVHELRVLIEGLISRDFAQ